jgi:hypothetical protein
MSVRNTVLLAAFFLATAAPALAAGPNVSPTAGSTDLSIGLQAGDRFHSIGSIFQNNLPAGSYSQGLTVGNGTAFASIQGLDSPTPHIDALASITQGADLGFATAGAQGFTDYSFVVSGVGDAAVTINASGSAGFTSLQTGAQGNVSTRFRVVEGQNGGLPVIFDQSISFGEVGGICQTSLHEIITSCAQSFVLSSDFLLHTNTLYTVHLDATASWLGGASASSPLGTNSAYANIDPTFTVHGPFTIQLSDGFGGGINLPSAGGGVPEPASWALMVLGFGGLGAALRTRRRGLTLLA